MKRFKNAIVVAFHKYTPFGDEYYEPILDFFLQNMREYKDEYDKLYLIDSTWNINPQKIEGLNAEIIKVNPHLRYYDAYKEVLPQIKEHLVLFMDNDMIVYKKGIISSTFKKLEEGYDVVSIYDTIGDFKTEKMNGKNKFCPYWFATGVISLKDFLRYDWGPNMPAYETLGQLTEFMLKDDVNPYELEEDKSNCLFNGSQDGEKGKDLGYYHIRAGSTPAYLLATKKSGNIETYNEYLKNQPKTEYLRQLAWYWFMCYCTDNADRMNDIDLDDFGTTMESWDEYIKKFVEYHGL